MRNVYRIACLVVTVSLFSSCLDNKIDNVEVKLVTAEEMQSILELEDVHFRMFRMLI